jgi:hypothetical protein
MDLSCNVKPVGKDFHAIVLARDQETGILRFQVSFRRKIGNGRLLEPFNRQEFNESGVMVACNREATINDASFHRMIRMAYTRLFKPLNKG